MNRLVLPMLAVTFLTAPASLGQIEMNSNGNIAMGTDVDDEYKLYVDCTSAADCGEGSPYISRVGVYARAIGGYGNLGVHGYGSGGFSNTGVKGVVVGSAGGYAYGIYGAVSGSGTKYAGYFSGNLGYTGDLVEISDERFKEDVQGLSGSEILAGLLKLTPRSYSFKSEYEFMGVPEGRQFGLIAEEVEPVFPELVKDQIHPGPIDEDAREIGEPVTYKGIDYVEIIPLLLQAIKQQQAQIDELKAALEAAGITIGGGGN